MKTALMARMLEAVTAEPEREAQHRMAQIQRAARDFRAAFNRSPDLARVSFPPMTAGEAERARGEAYHWSFHAHITNAKDAYRAEVDAINRAEVGNA